ncbi:hypothetical protein N0V90_009758 [Kalmusia sp. IMI 367209]|nr:hypothetical protein N0V90_009758 [Kalmusia sp. IMI 367209]
MLRDAALKICDQNIHRISHDHMSTTGTLIEMECRNDANEKSFQQATPYTDDEVLIANWPKLWKVDYRILPSFFLKQGLEQAKEWLSYCLQDHSTCRLHDDVSFPTRLIAVGSSTQNPYLYIPKPGETGSYSTLSYCWGKGKRSTTTKENVNERKTGFLLEELPKTCQDAIVVARSLGIPYIWIDQLCIIQNSKEDWETESAKMCSIYANSLLTLAAIDSPSSDIGFLPGRFPEKPMRPYASFDVTLPTSTAKHTVYVKRDMRENQFSFLHSLHRAPPPLETRLWTLQEIALSPRVLWFTDGDMAWSCRSTTACECEPTPTATRFGELPSHLAINLASRTQESRSWVPIWYRYVEEASQRLFTQQNDRLPALAGLAAAMGQHLNGRYVAGHWTNDIEASLMWEAVEQEKIKYEPDDPVPPMQEDYAPSWSWASTSRPITHSTSVAHDAVESPMHYKVLSIDFKPMTLNEWGPGMGVLLVRGVLISIKPTGHVNWNRKLFFTHETGANRLLFNQKGAEWTPDPKIDETAMQDRDLYMLIQLRWPEDLEAHSSGLMLGLILEKVGSEETARWEKRFRERVASEGTHIHIRTESDEREGNGRESAGAKGHTEESETNVYKRVGFGGNVFRYQAFVWEDLVAEYETTIRII